MHHVAIMKKSWGLIPKILTGEKSIESRWYKTRRPPWGIIKTGDTLFLKNGGELVTATATVSAVHQFEIETVRDAEKIIQKFGKQLCLVEPTPKKWGSLPRYCVLMELKNPKKVGEPFEINKKGFGAPAAWLTVKNIQEIKIRQHGVSGG